MDVPSRYAFLIQDPKAPNLVLAALEDYGLTEVTGPKSNPKIVAMADEVARTQPTPYNGWAADWYNNDDVPWCGLAMAYWACKSSGGRGDRMPPSKYLAALSWANFGEAVQFKSQNGKILTENILVGDVLVFVRNGGGHVGICVGITTNGKNLCVLGANQSNQVNITEIPFSRLYAVRRVPYVVKPAGARHVKVSSTGKISVTEQ